MLDKIANWGVIAGIAFVCFAIGDTWVEVSKTRQFMERLVEAVERGEAEE